MKSKTSGVLRTSFRIREIGGAIEILVNIGIAGHFLTELSICRLGSLTCLLIRLSKDLDLQDSGFIQITSAWPNCFWKSSGALRSDVLSGLGLQDFIVEWWSL